jgi:hypothetical protein
MRRILLLSIVAGMLAVLALAGTAYSRGNHVPASSESPDVLAAMTVQDEPAAAVSECGRLALSEEQAHRAVWELPEVEERAQEMRAQGVRPFTMTSSEPEARAVKGTESAAYVIYFGEDHGTHTVHVATFLVDPKTGEVTISTGDARQPGR